MGRERERKEEIISLHLCGKSEGGGEDDSAFRKLVCVMEPPQPPRVPLSPIPRSPGMTCMDQGSGKF